MTKVFKGIFYKRTKDDNAWYLKLERESCPSLEDTVRLRAVDNNGKFIACGAILDIDAHRGIRTHGALTPEIGVPYEEGRTRIKIFSF